MSLLSVLEQYFTVYHTPPFPADAIALSVNGKPLALKGDLTPREKALLSTLMPRPTSHNPWARFLAGETEAPTIGVVRLIQLITATPPEHSQLWLEALTSLFAVPVTGFWLTATHAVVVEPQSTTPATEVELLSMLNTLDNDFDTKTRSYCGQFWPTSSQLPAIFQEEQALAGDADARYASIATTALGFYTRDARAHSPLLTALRTAINQDPEMRPVITSLYEHLGNLTATAKALYIHRNTLQYRLDKFQQATGFALRQMDDLVLCALVTQDS